MPEPTGLVSSDGHVLRCMEIWGGNAAIDDGVSAPGIDAWFYSRPYHDEARGGDIHYASMCAAGHIARFVIADVSGHGAGVDDLAQRLRQLMRKHINTPNQTRFTRALNEELVATEQSGRFATALMATFFGPRSELIVSNAGHPKPMWYRSEADAWDTLHPEHDATLDEAGNLPLGIIEPTSYSQFAVRLAPGDVVVIVTDGLAEAKNDDGEMLGEDRLLEMVRGVPRDDLSRFIPALLSDHANYRGGAVLEDDLTVVVLHHNGAPPRRIGARERLGAMARMMGLGQV